MKYVWSFFWAFILVQMMVYVVGSMVGTTYDFKIGALLTIIIAIAVYIVSAVLPNEPVEKH
jgi:hypothetical protein